MSPTVTAPTRTGDTSLPVQGSWFTPDGEVCRRVVSGPVVMSSTVIYASEPSSTVVYGPAIVAAAEFEMIRWRLCDLRDLRGTTG